MAEQIDTVEEAVHVVVMNALGGLLVERRQHDGRQAFHDQRIGIHRQIQGVGITVVIGFQPHLALAAAHKPVFGLQVVREAGQLLAQVDDIAITLFPVIQKFQILGNVLGGHVLAKLDAANIK